MSTKLKPSSKEYKKDRNGRMTSKWEWKHYTVASTSTEELIKLYDSPSYKRKKELIRKELVKRGAWENLKKK